MKVFGVSLTPESDRPYVFVKLETNQGVVGWGPGRVAAVFLTVGVRPLSHPPVRVPLRHVTRDPALDRLGRRGLLGHGFTMPRCSCGWTSR